MKLNVLLVDDHVLFREGMTRALRLNKAVGMIYHASDGEEALGQLKAHLIDIVFMDIMMKGMGGIECTCRAMKLYPKLRIIAISQFDDEENIRNMLKSGASGYMVKTAGLEEINAAIASFVAGKNYFSREVQNVIVNSMREDEKEPGIKFTNKEMDVLQLLCRQYSYKQIARDLNIAESSVRWYKQVLIQKTGSKNVAGLVSFAIKKGLYKT